MVLSPFWFLPRAVCLGNISVFAGKPNKNNRLDKNSLIKDAGTFSFVNT